jgi:hypothetical protein
MTEAIGSAGRVLRVAMLLLVASVPVAGQSAATVGQWQTLPYLMPINPIHVALMHTGKVLVVAGSGNLPANILEAAVWDPQADTITVQAVSWDMFRNAMVVLPDGRPFIDGGTLQYEPLYGQPKASVFDPATNTFSNVANMAHGRWYPTSTVLGDGTVMTFSGLDTDGSTTQTVEIFDPSTATWSTPYVASWAPPLYPRMHLLPNGNVLYSGASPTSSIFDTSTHTWDYGVANTNYGSSRTYGSSVLLPLTPANNYAPKVMILGGGSPATNTTEIIDLSIPSPKWQYAATMYQGRIEMNAVLLPNGKVLALGGSVNDEDATTASLQAEIYDPAFNTFSSAGSEAYARLYQSVALLMPDGTVWVAGGNPQRGTYEQHMEVYFPPYLFTQDANGNTFPAARPSISGAPSTIGYGANFVVQTPDAANISSVVLMRNGADTHAFDMDQRLVGLSFTAGSGYLTVTGPPNSNIAPAGYYMLFLLNDSGVPSLAAFVQVLQLAVPTFSPAASGTLEAIDTQSGFTHSALGSAISTCVQNLAIGNFTLCGEAYNDVHSGSSVSVNYSPAQGNGIIAWATWCFNSSCNSSTAGITATIGDNINATESCFTASPNSPFITNANGGAQGSGDFQQHYVWYCPSIPSGVTSFTMTPSNSSLSYLQLNINEWKAGSLAASCSPISACFEDVDNFGQAGNSTGGTIATITTSGSTVNANDLVFAVTEVPCCSFTASPGTGYTGITVAPSVTPGMVSEAKAATATGIQTATTTWTGGSTPWFGVIVPLKGAGAAPAVATPTFSPGTGSYSSAQTVTISSTTTGASICYTSDGTTPAAKTPGTCSTGTSLANGGKVTVSASGTLKAIGTESGLNNSGVAKATYTIGVAFVQVAAATPQSPMSAVSVAYPAVQSAGNLNVIVVGWNDSTSVVNTISDTAGNAYQLAIGPTRGTNFSQCIYYAPKIKAGANRVTVTFNQLVAYVDLRALEYKGVNTLDAKVGASGKGSTSNSGSAKTTVASELIFGANTVAHITNGSGAGFTPRIITSPDGDIAEDRVVSATGSYRATAPLTGNGTWVMQMVTFK